MLFTHDFCVSINILHRGHSLGKLIEIGLAAGIVVDTLLLEVFEHNKRINRLSIRIKQNHNCVNGSVLRHIKMLCPEYCLNGRHTAWVFENRTEHCLLCFKAVRHIHTVIIGLSADIHTATSFRLNLIIRRPERKMKPLRHG